MLANEPRLRQTILKDFRDGYNYRSDIAHGRFVFDDVQDWETARAMKSDKGKGGNPFHHVNEVHRLKHALAGYYKVAISKVIRSGELQIDWGKFGL